MLAVVLGTASALLYGVSDFFGGVAARRQPALRVTLLGFAISGVVVLPALAVLPSVWSPAAVLTGAVGGVFGAVSLWCIYGALAAGPVGVVAPAVALLSALLPALVALAAGERVTPPLLVALAIVVAAGVLLGLEPDARRRPAPRTLLLTVVSGVTSAAYLVVVNASPNDSGLVPLAADTAAGVVVLGAVSLVRRLRDRVPGPRLRRRDALLIVGNGLATGAASVLLVTALHLPQLAIVSALAALYPVGTVGLGFVVLGERIRAVQLVGVLAGIAGVALLSLTGT